MKRITIEDVRAAFKFAKAKPVQRAYILHENGEFCLCGGTAIGLTLMEMSPEDYIGYGYHWDVAMLQAEKEYGSNYMAGFRSGWDGWMNPCTSENTPYQMGCEDGYKAVCAMFDA